MSRCSMMIGRFVHSRLSPLFGGRCYPVVAPQGAGQTPFAVYRTAKIEPDYTKDGSLWDRVTVEVITVGRSYDEAVRASMDVRDALEDCRETCTIGNPDDMENRATVLMNVCSGPVIGDGGLQDYADGYDETGQLYACRARYAFTVWDG